MVIRFDFLTVLDAIEVYIGILEYCIATIPLLRIETSISTEILIVTEIGSGSCQVNLRFVKSLVTLVSSCMIRLLICLDRLS